MLIFGVILAHLELLGCKVPLTLLVSSAEINCADIYVKVGASKMRTCVELS